MPTFVDAFNQTPDSFTGFGSATFRTVFLSGVLSNTGLTYCRVTFAASDVTGLILDKAYVQTQGAGDAYDFSATPIQLLFGGGAGFTISAGQQKASDVAVFSIPASTNIVISGTISTASQGVGGKSGLATGNRLYFKTAVDEAATIDVTGYTASTDGTVWPIARIEVAGSDGFFFLFP